MECHIATAALPLPTAIWISEPTMEGYHIGQLASSSVSPDAGTLQVLGKVSSVLKDNLRYHLEVATVQ